MKRLRQRPYSNALAVLGGLPLIFIVAVVFRSAVAEVDTDFYCRRTVSVLPQEGPLARAQTVSFMTSLGDQVVGWWQPGSLGRVIVIVHGSSGYRGQFLSEGEMLSTDGYSVLLIDLPGCGESSGHSVWGRAERAALEAAVNFAVERSGSSDVGVLAFSLGAMIAAQVAAADRRIRALVLEGAPTDFDELMRFEYKKFWRLSAFGASFGARIAGFRNDAPSPLRSINRVNAVLLVTGTDDRVVSSAMSERLFEVAKGSKTLLRIPGAGHGNYERTVGRASYRTALINFYNGHLRATKS
jgi:pimeloyl-ACP methyl ester carboxylesterase